MTCWPRTSPSAPVRKRIPYKPKRGRCKIDSHLLFSSLPFDIFSSYGYNSEVSSTFFGPFAGLP